MSNREDVINAYRQKNHDLAVSNARSKAKDKLAGMSDTEKMALSKVNEAVKATSVEKVYEMLQVIKLADS